MRHLLVIFASVIFCVSAKNLPLERILHYLENETDKALCITISLKEYLNLFLSAFITDSESAERDFILWPEFSSEGPNFETESFPPFAYISVTTPVSKDSFFSKETKLLDERRVKAKELIKSVHSTVDPLARARLLLKLMMNRVYNERTVLASLLWEKVLLSNYAYDLTLASHIKFLSPLRTQVGVKLKEELQHEFEKVKAAISLSTSPMTETDIKILTSDFESMSERILESINKKVLAAEQNAGNHIPHLEEFNWMQKNCHHPNPSNPQLNDVLKRVAGKVLAHYTAAIDEKTLSKTIRALAYIIPDFHIGSVPDTWGLKIPGLPKFNIPYTRKLKSPGFSKNDVTRKQKITIPSGADVNYVVSNLLAGDGPICNHTCVERFINWAVDELKNDTSKEFVIAVRNKLRGS